MFNETMIAATTTAAAVVPDGSVRTPMTRPWLVNQTSGISANGMPNERVTWLRIGVRNDAVLRQRRVQPDQVLHHARAEDADGEQLRFASLKARHECVLAGRRPVGLRLEDLDHVAEPDRKHDSRDHCFEQSHAPAL